MKLIALTALTVVLAGCCAPKGGRTSASSIVGDLRQSAEKETAHLLASFVLALKCETDARPWHGETALLVFKCADERWWLITAARTPLREGPAWRRQWHVAEVVDAWYGAEEFHHRPTREDTLRFLRNTWWDEPVREGWHRERAEVYSEEWRAALGFDPLLEFTRGGANLRSAADAGSAVGFHIRDQGSGAADSERSASP